MGMHITSRCIICVNFNYLHYSKETNKWKVLDLEDVTFIPLHWASFHLAIEQTDGKILALSS